MYKDQVTGELIGPNIPMNKVVVEKRERVYEKTIRHGPNKGMTEQVYGWEIVKEVIVGPDTYRKMTGEEPNKLKPSEVGQEARVVDREPDPWRRRRNNRQPFKQKRPEVEHVRSPKQGSRT